MFIAASILVLWYAAHAVLSGIAGTCTMGGTDRFAVGLFVGAPAALIAVPLILLRPMGAPWQRVSLVVPLLATPVVLWIFVPLAVSASLGGHNLCGAGFDDHLSTADRWERFIPLLHVVLATPIL